MNEIRSLNKNIQQPFTCHHMLPKQIKYILLLGLNYEAVHPLGTTTLHMYNQSRKKKPVSLLYATCSESRYLACRHFIPISKQCLLVCMLCVSPPGCHSYMHVLSWVTAVKGEAQAQETSLLVLLSPEKVSTKLVHNNIMS